jgi:hypothetical protein
MKRYETEIGIKMDACPPRASLSFRKNYTIVDAFRRTKYHFDGPCDAKQFASLSGYWMRVSCWSNLIIQGQSIVSVPVNLRWPIVVIGNWKSARLHILYDI